MHEVQGATAQKSHDGAPVAMAVHAPRDVSLRVFHRLGANQLVLSLQLEEGQAV